MKSAYELAMERLNADSSEDSQAPLSEEQKGKLSDIDKRYKAKIAEKEIFLVSQIESARAKGDLSEVSAIQRQLSSEKERLEEECEQEKNTIRKA
ncbi:hypothetical protein MLD52_09740 [Puniceicoccaceae bacterium K14]|nr:hypothetical protein [Puniceicoccaceae bacterium K14]